MTLGEAQRLFLDLLKTLEPMPANPWPVLCVSALIECLTKMVNGSHSGAQKYKQFVETYLAGVNPRYKTFVYAGGQQDLRFRCTMCCVARFVHSFNLIPDGDGNRSGSKITVNRHST